jgi:hypothetical protein
MTLPDSQLAGYAKMAASKRGFERACRHREPRQRDAYERAGYCRCDESSYVWCARKR